MYKHESEDVFIYLQVSLNLIKPSTAKFRRIMETGTCGSRLIVYMLDSMHKVEILTVHLKPSGKK